MNETVGAALSLWGLDGAEVALIAARENAVFRARLGELSYAIRLHRKGYRTDAELASELAWMDAAARGGLSVPAPIASRKGVFLHLIDGYQVDVLTWLPGAPLSAPGGALKVADRAGTYRKLGREMARLHDVSDAWQRPADFSRWHWDRNGLVGADPLWDRFWNNPGLSDVDRRLMLEFRVRSDADLRALEDTLDYGLIHADLISANVMSHEGRIALIDFDDGGFGFRLFDVATALLKLQSETDYPELKKALISGYREERGLDTDALDLFLALRAATYLGWNITRMDEPGGEARNARFIEAARGCAEAYMNKD